MIFLDTSYFVAICVKSDSLHSRSLAWSRWVSDRLLTTEYVLVEFANAISTPPLRSRIDPVLQWALTNSNVVVVPATRLLLDKGIRLHRERSDKSWSLTDCASFIAMDQHGVRQALTYDHHFQQSGYEALLRFDPPAN